jgi:hypothetical protein
VGVGLPFTLDQIEALASVLVGKGYQAKDINCMSKLCLSCSFSVNVLLSCDGLLFLTNPLNILLNSGKLLLYCSFIL